MNIPRMSNTLMMQDFTVMALPLSIDSQKQALKELAVCSQGPVPLDFLQHLTELNHLPDILEQLSQYYWCNHSVIDYLDCYELHPSVHDWLQHQLVDEAIARHHSSTVHHLYIDNPQDDVKLDRWIAQTDAAVWQMKIDQDPRLSHWAAGRYCQYCLNRGHGERFIKHSRWVNECCSDAPAIQAMAYGNQAMILKAWDRLDEAMALHYKEQLLYQQVGDLAGISRSYAQQALILEHIGQFNQALTLLTKNSALKEAMGDQLGAATCYANQALIFKLQGKISHAISMLQKQQTIGERLQNKPLLAVCYANLAEIFHAQGQLQASLALHLKEEAMYKALNNQAGQAICCWHQGELHHQLGDHRSQKKLWHHAIDLFHSLKLPIQAREKEYAELEYIMAS